MGAGQTHGWPSVRMRVFVLHARLCRSSHELLRLRTVPRRRSLGDCEQLDAPAMLGWSSGARSRRLRQVQRAPSVCSCARVLLACWCRASNTPEKRPCMCSSVACIRPSFRCMCVCRSLVVLMCVCASLHGVHRVRYTLSVPPCTHVTPCVSRLRLPPPAYMS